jgi:hypothetical protein
VLQNLPFPVRQLAEARGDSAPVVDRPVLLDLDRFPPPELVLGKPLLTLFPELDGDEKRIAIHPPHDLKRSVASEAPILVPQASSLLVLPRLWFYALLVVLDPHQRIRSAKCIWKAI